MAKLIFAMLQSLDGYVSGADFIAGRDPVLDWSLRA